MSCRIGYMYMQQGKCRLVDVELQIHSHVEDVEDATGKVFIGGCAYTGV